MKKKLMSLLSLILVVVMICPTVVFADDTGATTAETDTSVVSDSVILYYDSTIANKKSTTIECTGAKTWSVITGTDVVSVNNGTVTALKAGTATVCAFDDSTNQIGKYTITVKAVALTKLEIIATDSRSSYVSGTTISKSDLKVKATYNDGFENPDFKDYTISPSTAVTENGSMKVSSGNITSAEFAYTVNKVSIEDMVTGISISAPASSTEYTVGDTIKTSDIVLSIAYVGGVNNSATLASLNDAECNLEFTSAGKYTFSNDDQKAGTKTITVSYAGKTASVTVKVKAKSTSGGNSSTTQNTYQATKTGDLRTKTYKVGDQLKFDGITITFTVKNGNTTISTDTLTADQLNSSFSYTFTEDDKGTNKSIYVKITYNGHEYSIPFSGLTVTAATDDSKVREITDIELNEDAYPIGYVFSRDDIEKLVVKFVGDSKSRTIYGYSLSDYDFFSDLTIEVLDNDGDRKSSSSRYVIEDDDVIEDKYGDEIVNMRLYYQYYKTATSSKSNDYLDFNIDISESVVSYIYDGKIIAIYDELEDALGYCIEDDNDWSNFDLDDVSSRKYVTLKLGKDYKIRSSFDDFTPSECNIVIDLNGHNLRFNSDTIVVDRDDKDRTVTITNSSKTEAKFEYYDKGITIVLGEDDKFEFKYDSNAADGYLPGIVTVTATVGKGGKISASPSLSSKGTVDVGMGSDIKFTITPEKDYAVDTIKVNSKTVSTNNNSDYSVSSTGIVTYTLKGVSANTKVEVTFKETKKAWANPFSDVSEKDSYYSAVEFVYTHELFKGTTATKFAPDTTMTRAMFVTVLGRLADVDVSKYKTSSFTDIPLNSTTSWYAPYVQWAVDYGIVEGFPDGTFLPNNEITHQQMYVMMYRYSMFVENNPINVRNVYLSNISDRADIADWASDAVKYGQQKNYLVLSGNRVDPTGKALRRELATLLESFCSTVLNWAD